MIGYIYCDACLHKSHPFEGKPLAGAASYILSEKGNFKVGKAFQVNSINAAETRIAYLSTRFSLKCWNLKTVVVKTDSLAFVDAFRNGRAIPKLDDFRRELDRIRGFLGNYKINFRPEWVKGHQKNDTTDAFYNNKADYLSKKVIRPYLKKRRKLK